MFISTYARVHPLLLLLRCYFCAVYFPFLFLIRKLQADPFFVVEFAGKEIYKSKVIKKTLDPKWFESAKILVTHLERKYSITIKVYDWDKASSNGMKAG